jgi:hypothetical protein
MTAPDEMRQTIARAAPMRPALDEGAAHEVTGRRYTHTRAGGMFFQIRSEASARTPASFFGMGGTTA